MTTPRDARIYCRDCRELYRDRRCGAAVSRRRRDVDRDYQPAELDLPRACEFFAPKRGDADQRPGSERFPVLWRIYQEARQECERLDRGAAARGVERARRALGGARSPP